MRVAILWNCVPLYLNVCLRALADIPGTELFVSRRLPYAGAPYDNDEFAWLQSSYTYESEPAGAQLVPQVRAFNPDVLLVASWNHSAYRKLCREFRGRAVRICAMDNQWRGTARQWIGVLTAPLYVRDCFDVAFVPGDRQASFARRFGFPEQRIWHGFYSCDHARFSATLHREPAEIGRRRAFLYVGRLVENKAVDTLLLAYRKYRLGSAVPWPLYIAGEGPLRARLEREPGVCYQGFLQPNKLPDLFSKASCFVLPSRFEPWGVVIHEATAAGLPVICTPECGAAVHLVQDRYNGFLFAKDDEDALASAMSRLAALPDAALADMAAASVRQSLQFTPERWAECVYQRSRDFLAGTPAAVESKT
jgi:glycosyltransferase involved in cell wall biosynthesis